MEFLAHDKILLTGAGFTKNFGAPLAREVWAQIFNQKEIQESARVREVMINFSNFEAAYDLVMTGDFGPDEKRVMANAIKSVYEGIDVTVRNFVFNRDSPYPVNTYRLNNLIDQFAQPANDKEKTFFFTLNQDLFIERKYTTELMQYIPGIQNHSDWFTTRFDQPLNSYPSAQLPTKVELEQRKQEFPTVRKHCYLKLHGSSNWVDSDGNQMMVIGRGKDALIEKEPLFAWYFDIFRDVLFRSDRRLLVIGYGFGDDHINEVLAKAVVEHGLRIFVVRPGSHEEFLDFLSETSDGLYIRDGLSGYYPYSLREIFPSDQSRSQALREIYDSFFEISLPI